MGDSTLIVSLLLILVLLHLLLIAHQAILLGVLLTAFLLPLTIFPVVDMRLFLPLIFILLVPRLIRERTMLIVGPVPIGIMLFGLTCLVSLAWSDGKQETLLAAIVTLIVAAVITLINSGIKSTTLLRAMQIFAASVIGLCLLYAFFPVGVLAGRVRGIFNNPNGLAVFVVVVLPILTRSWWRAFAACGVGLVLFSSSRAGTVACVAELVVILAGGSVSRTSRRILLSGVIVVAVLVGLISLNDPAQTSSVANPDRSVLRLRDSRSELWQNALAKWQESPILGAGADASKVETANSFLILLVNLGLIGVLAVMPLMVYLIGRIFKGSPRIAALAMGALINSLFESWLFTAGSIYFLLLWLQLADAWKAEKMPTQNMQFLGRQTDLAV